MFAQVGTKLTPLMCCATSSSQSHFLSSLILLSQEAICHAYLYPESCSCSEAVDRGCARHTVWLFLPTVTAMLPSESETPCISAFRLSCAAPPPTSLTVCSAGLRDRCEVRHHVVLEVEQQHLKWLLFNHLFRSFILF